MRQLSPFPPFNRGVLPNFARRLFPAAAIISWTCSSPNPSSWSWYPSPVSTRPFASLPREWTPFLTHWFQFVASRFNMSPAKIRSPAASCTFMWMLEHCIAMTISKLICRLMPTSFSTETVWFSWPRHHWVNSENVRKTQTTSIATVHFPPPEVRVMYWGLDFAGSYCVSFQFLIQVSQNKVRDPINSIIYVGVRN